METFADLAPLGFPAARVRALEEAFGTGLLPLQRRVLGETGLLRTAESVLIAAPTASGKTLPAELAAVRAIDAGRTAWYMVPTRALAEQKAREFAARHAASGVRVACTSGDCREHDGDILRGRVHLVVAVYEKALALFNRQASLLDGCGVLVADEVQIVGDPERGAGIDFLLTRWRKAPAPRPQLVALSAVLGNPDELAAWLGVRLVRSDARPIPLREGVLDSHSGVFRWRETGTGRTGRETLLPAADGDAHHPALLDALARSHGPLIVFCATKPLAARLALDIAALRTARPGEATTRLRLLPQDRSREALEELLPVGVGLHTADLTPAQRRLVEAAFDDAEVDILVATPTLEQGVNLSAATVVQSPMMIGRAPFGGDGSMVPVSRQRFLNQGGRAGRSGDLIGRSMTIVEDDAEAERAWARLIVPAPEDARSPLGAADTQPLVAALLAKGRPTRTSVEEWFAATLAGSRSPAEVRARVRADLDAGTEGGLWREDALRRLEPTGLGEAVARTGIAAATARAWAELLRGCAEAPGDDAALFLVMLADEWETVATPLGRDERRRGGWPTGLLDRMAGRDELARRLRARLESPTGAPMACHKAARRTLMLAEWLDGLAPYELEYRHETSTGQMARVAGQACWLATAAAEVAGAVGCPAAMSDAFVDLADRLGALGREAPPREEAAQAPPDSVAVDEGSLRTLAFPADDPGAVDFDGARVKLTPNQYQFLLCLARRAGRTVPYAAIHAEVWPDAAVEQQQIPYYRREVQRRLLPRGGADVIATSHGWGLALLVRPERVQLPPVLVALEPVPA